MLNFAIVLYSITVCIPISMCILSFICKEEMGTETQAILQPGELCIFLYYLSFKGMLVIMINACHAVPDTAMD